MGLPCKRSREVRSRQRAARFEVLPIVCLGFSIAAGFLFSAPVTTGAGGNENEIIDLGTGASPFFAAGITSDLIPVAGWNGDPPSADDVLIGSLGDGGFVLQPVAPATEFVTFALVAGA